MRDWKCGLRSAALGIVLTSSAMLCGAQTAPGVDTPGSTKPAAYDCFGLEGVPLTRCKSLNAEHGTSSSVAASTVPAGGGHDCADMTGDSLATCQALNGAGPESASGAWSQQFEGQGTVAPSAATPPSAIGASGTPSSAGFNPTALSSGSGATTSSSGSAPTGLSGGSGKTQSSNGTAPNTVSGGMAAGRAGASGK
jgi:hypothetical protein